MEKIQILINNEIRPGMEVQQSRCVCALLCGETLVSGIHKYLFANLESRGSITSVTPQQLREAGGALRCWVSSQPLAAMGCWTPCQWRSAQQSH